MSEHKVTLHWERGGADFTYQKYPRDHTWSFDGGHTMTASAAPAYLGNPVNVDPEEAFVASLSSCHMLTFLSIACKQKFVLDEYIDEAIGHMEKNSEGKMAITRVELRPKIRWSGDKTPTAEELDKMHHAAHDNRSRFGPRAITRKAGTQESCSGEARPSARRFFPESWFLF